MFTEISRLQEEKKRDDKLRKAIGAGKTYRAYEKVYAPPKQGE